MSKKWKYILAVAVAAVVVIGSALLPPTLARKSDRSFLNQVMKDSRTSESYKYKPTKYQKMHVLYQAVQDSWGYMPSSEEKAKYLESDMFGVQVESSPYLPSDSLMNFNEAKRMAKEALDQLGNNGALPFYPEDTDNIVIEGVQFLALQDLRVSNTKFYFWDIFVSDSKTGDFYQFMMDDEQGKIYAINCIYNQADEIILKGWDNYTSAIEKANIFANQHEMEVTKKISGNNVAGYEILHYATEDSDYEVEFVMKTNGIVYNMLLKPSDY